ncbi:MAG: PH domain-containing protein [Actinobacteria bacterium]|nr:PH domain-containing protein [Actinomycetota bacterium]
MSSGRRRIGQVFRLPASAYLIVLFLIFGTVPLAFTESAFNFGDTGGEQGPPPFYGWPMIFLLIPILAAVFIRRTATIVTPAGIRVRAVFGSRRMAWTEVRGLSVNGNSVYAVLADGSVRLPCVRQADLGAVSRASGGYLPEIGEEPAKHAPARRRRR